MAMTPENFLEEANKWEAKATEHIRLADFCRAQAERMLGQVAVPTDYKPQLELVWNASDPQA